jgi:hypothetical protein
LPQAQRLLGWSHALTDACHVGMGALHPAKRIEKIEGVRRLLQGRQRL